jgi:peptidoglycan/LPS O-acetylase OafA/YrhL
MRLLALASVFFVAFLVITTRRDSPALYVGGFSLAAAAIAATLLTLIAWPPAPAIALLRFRPLTWVGRISYGLYLWHWPVRGLIFGKSAQPSSKQIIIAIVVSFAISAFSFYLIELPFLRWKKRFSHA